MSRAIERERLDVDILIVGAGIASLSAAFYLSRLLEAEASKGNQKAEKTTILVVEKSREIGGHILSGAVIDPGPIDDLISGLDVSAPPYDSPVTAEDVFYLTRKRSFKSPIIPPPLRNHGNYVASLGNLVRWLAELCIERGIEIYPGFPAVELLFDGNRVVGARLGDQGRDRHGKGRENYEPGMEVRARVTVLGEGPQGTLTGQASRRLDLYRDAQPQIYSIGVKEVWKVKKPVSPGLVIHTLGYPLCHEEFGGGFLYAMKENRIHLGMVVGLDYRDPEVDSHRLLQKLKLHPLIREKLEGGEVISYGARVIPEGGYYSLPKCYGDGLLIIGDSAGLLNSQRLKGIHLAVQSGILSAQTIFEGLQMDDFSEDHLSLYWRRFDRGWAGQELRKVRNFRQGFQEGFWSGMIHAGMQYLTGGRGIRDPLPMEAGHERLKRREGASGQRRPSENGGLRDADLVIDRLSDVYLSDTAHDEDQPCHLKVLDTSICQHRCTLEYGNPCQYFCPASVYEIVGNPGSEELKVNFSNCVHCKTCEIMDPYQIIHWSLPEGGGGPNWRGM